ncbi:hypothetical protein HHL22_11885 [Hymenobacter sp. RP-2-7]|uniref:Type I restriction modification DNA specificity domain-containing protein n=1 Tax=Hymenobacter polaris TaxID=2682546 RepID=A0A7Y0AEH5_9BACT|nr:restriction endonuclease subunit S [Hymenobacter polaris]NML65906.1 hypothetical protein [Hymenobacter polaris]
MRLSDSVQFARAQVTNNDGGLPYVGLENVESNTGVYLPTGDKESISSAFLFRPGQILFPKLRPYLNKVLLADFAGICSTEFHVLDPVRFTPSFLALYLRTGLVLNQTKWLTSGNTLPRLQTADVEGLLIPNCNAEMQATIAKLGEQAQEEADAAKAQARTHLTSLDTHLVAALGLTLPSTGSVPLAEREFQVRFRQVAGQRLDPKWYDPRTQALRQAIEASPFPKVPLRDLLLHTSSGDWGYDAEDPDVLAAPAAYVRRLVVRATEFDNFYNLNVDGERAKYRILRKEKARQLDVRADDLLLEKSGGSENQPVGRVALLTPELLNNYPLAFSNFIFKFRPDPTQILPAYLFNFLRFVHNIRLTDAMQSQTNGIRNLIMSQYLSQSIILPPLARQQELADQLDAIRAEAKRLQQAAQATLANARQQIEVMILGTDK